MTKRIKRGKLRSKRKVRRKSTRKSTRKSKRKSQSKSRKKYKYQCGGAGCCDSEAYGSSEGRKVAMLREVLGAYGVSTDGLYTFDFLGAQDHTEWVIRVNEDEKDMKRIRESLCLLIPPIQDEKSGVNTRRIDSIKKNYAYRHPVHVNGPAYRNINEKVMIPVLGYGKRKATDIIGSWNRHNKTVGERMALNHRYSVIGWTPVCSDGFKNYNIITNDMAKHGGWNPEVDGTWFLHAWGVNLEGQWTLDYNYCFNHNAFQITKYVELMNQMFESIEIGIKHVSKIKTKNFVVIRIPQLGLGAWKAMVPDANILQIYELYGTYVNELSQRNQDVIILYPIYDAPMSISKDNATKHLPECKGTTDQPQDKFNIHWTSPGSGVKQFVSYSINSDRSRYFAKPKNFTYILWNNANLSFDYKNPVYNQKFEEHADPFGTFDKLDTFLNGIPDDPEKFSLINNCGITYETTFEWILVNAWDDGSFIGNMGVKDPTQDGWTVAGSTNKSMGETPVASDLPGVKGRDKPMGFQTENAAYLHNAMFQEKFKVITLLK